MGKAKSEYVCQSCGARSARWAGKCDQCGAWNSFVEELVPKSTPAKGRTPASEVFPITGIPALAEDKMKTHSSELDRVMGGGVVPGSVTLLGGDPGIGKSTLMMQLCHHLATRVDSPRPVLYISGEESPHQLRLRSDRLHAGSDRLLVATETDAVRIAELAERIVPSLVVVDSIQTIQHPDLESSAGSVSQLKESAARLIACAKTTGIPFFVIGHVTKDGYIAGPRVLEHMVDTVLQFEGDARHQYRLVRSIKNRFGGANEIGLFDMRVDGLFDIVDPSSLFITTQRTEASGSCITTYIEGTRALVIEVQALVSKTNYGIPQRSVTGMDGKRLAMILAVIDKRYGLQLGMADVFVNIAGGVKVDEPAIDLAVAAAIVSSRKDRPLPPTCAVMGELGLGGEVRSVHNLDSRVAEASRLGFDRWILPKGNLSRKPPKSVTVHEVETLADCLRVLAI